jgi:hypothetical protein
MPATGYLFPEVTLAQAKSWNYFMQDLGSTCFHEVAVERVNQFILTARKDQEDLLHDEMLALCILLKILPRRTLVTIHAPSKYVEFHT